MLTLFLIANFNNNPTSNFLFFWTSWSECTSFFKLKLSKLNRNRCIEFVFEFKEQLDIKVYCICFGSRAQSFACFESTNNLFGGNIWWMQSQMLRKSCSFPRPKNYSLKVQKQIELHKFHFFELLDGNSFWSVV